MNVLPIQRHRVGGVTRGGLKRQQEKAQQNKTENGGGTGTYN